MIAICNSCLNQSGLLYMTGFSGVLPYLAKAPTRCCMHCLLYALSLLQVCEVKVELVSIGASTSHWITATLTADHTRAYKIDGKNKTARDVKVSAVDGTQHNFKDCYPPRVLCTPC